MNKVLSDLLHSLSSKSDPIGTLPLDHLSDLDTDTANSLGILWGTIPAPRRIDLLKELGDREAIQFDLDFSEVYYLGLKDSEPEAVANSINNLSQIENTNFFPSLIELLSHTDTLIREAAADALGRFVYLGELEEISSEDSDRIVNLLLNTFRTDSSTEVRCRSLESLGYSSHKDVPGILLSSFNSGDLVLAVSVMKAISRSADSSWKSLILDHLHNTHPEIRLEAVRAAGELEIREARSDLIELLEDVDRQVHLAAIWSLAQIGGDNIQELLTQIQSETGDIEETDLIEDALDLLEFNAGTGDFLLLDLEEGQSD